MRKRNISILLWVLLLWCGTAANAQRFPKPEFEGGHTQPAVQQPSPRSNGMEYADVFVLFASLSVVSWLVIRRRSRRGVLYMAIFSVVYFGFVREGCICSVGSLQNVALALFNPGYAIPVTTILFFVLPLIFTLFFGRTFCAGVCPLGAIQDLVAVKPYEIRPWLQKTLGILPFLYLGLAVLYAATASDFIICRYDPFVGIYRLDGTFLMFSIGGLLLLIGIFIARPYCRFLCPYGVLLNWVSRFSKYHMSITPSVCIDCKLCENACPYGAIEKPVPSNIRIERKQMVGRFLALAVIVPLLAFLGGYTGRLISEELAMVNPRVRLAAEIMEAEANPELPLTVNVEAFRSSGTALTALLDETDEIRHLFRLGSMWMGIFFGLAIGISLASLATLRYRTDYEPNKGSCLSCARCMDFCPVEKNGVINELKLNKS